MLGFVGSRAEAEEIKRLLAVFLRDHLKLELSEEKTLITHAPTEKARFLDYHIHTLHEDTQRDDRDQRSLNGKIGLRVPEEVIEEKCRSLMSGHKVKHRPELYQESDFTILNTYQSEYRGVVNDYRLAYNLTNLDKWIGACMNSERNRAGRAGFFRKEQLAASLSSTVSRLFGKACTPCTNPPGSMAFNAPRKAVEETGEVGEGRAHAAHLLHERCMSWEKPHTTVLMSAWRLVDKGSRFFAGARRRELQQHLIAVDHAHRFASSALYMSPVGTPRALLGEQVYPQFCRAELVGRGALRTQASETWSEG